MYFLHFSKINTCMIKREKLRNKLNKETRPSPKRIQWKGIPAQLCGNTLSALFSFILIILPENGKIKNKPK